MIAGMTAAMTAATLICKMETVNSLPIPDFTHQGQQFASAFSILDDAIANRVFPAASLAVTHQGRLIALKAFGKFVYESDLERTNPEVAPPVSVRFLHGQGGNIDLNPSTPFDLASLTKVVATTTMAAILYQRGLLDLEAPIVGTLPEFFADSSGMHDSRRQKITFRMLLAHSSGLPAYEKLFLRCRSRNELLHAAFTTPLESDPGSHAEYSDIGFIMLGTALERIAAETLERFCQREIFGPLAMTHTAFNPPAEVRSRIPPTADERECGAGSSVRSTLRNRIVQGEVQDENAFVLGGVAGHAGLFSTAEDLALFAHAMLRAGDPILRPETINLFTQRESAPTNTSRALGWDTPSHPSQSGKHFSPRSFGHLGYTGTSLWIDADRQLSISLLTNRTWPDSASQAIKQLRPRFHDAVIEALPDM